MRKRRISVMLLSMIMLMTLLWGCGDNAQKKELEEDKDFKQENVDEQVTNDVQSVNNEVKIDKNEISVEKLTVTDNMITDNIKTEQENKVDSYKAFCEKRETFWYYYIVESDYTWSLERDMVLQFWKKYDFENIKNYKNNVCAYYVAVDCILYVENGVDIHMVDHSGENDVLLFSASEEVKEIVGTGEYFFYLTDVGVYRYHIESGTNEFACPTNDGYWLAVIDNQTFRFAEDHGEMAYSEEDGYYCVPEFFIFDMTKKEEGAVNVTDKEEQPTLNFYDEQITNSIRTEQENKVDSYKAFCEKREKFWYYYQEDSDYIWSLERNGDFQFWRKGDLSTLKLYKQNISEYYPAYNCVFYIENGVDIHMMDYSGENDVLLFSASENVIEIVGNREYCFYLTDVGVYRYHIESGTNEFACPTNDGYWLAVIDNQTFRFAEDHGEVAYSEEDGYYSVPDCFIFDMLKKEQGAVNVDDMENEPTLNKYEEQEAQEY